MIEVNEHQYAKLLHEKMQEHPAYKEGMSVEVTPATSGMPSGLRSIGGLDSKSIMAWAEKELEDKYMLVISR